MTAVWRPTGRGRCLALTLGLAGALQLSTLAPALGSIGPQRVTERPDAGEIGEAEDYIVTVQDGGETTRAARAVAAAPRQVYSHVLTGFAARLRPDQVEALHRHPGVVAVERDGVVRLADTQTIAPASGLHGLDRVDQARLPLSGRYTTTATGSGVTAYVIDTGLDVTHPDFSARAAVAHDVLGGTGEDCNGHGTHVAGTVGGTIHGVAKTVQLRGVRVLDCAGSGTVSGLLAALDWVRANAARPAVATMSLSGPHSPALDAATADLAASGVFVAVAAGNANRPACEVSPASTAAALVVAASDSTDTRGGFSNYGSCVDLYAPGVDVASTWLSGGTARTSGTSMAAPHAAGVAALYKSRYGDAASATVHKWIVGKASPKAVRGNPPQTPNLLLSTGGL